MNEIPGYFLYNNIHTVQQVPTIKDFFTKLLVKENFSTIIELGTSFGGLTYIINDIIIENNLINNIHTFDNSYKSYVNDQLTQRGCFYHVLDERDLDYQNLVKSLILDGGKCLILCDGGNKKEEFNRYSEFLKHGDIIMAHDYSSTNDVFENEIKNKIWNWWEINYNDIKESVEKYKLTNYKEIDFKEAVWACFQK